LQWLKKNSFDNRKIVAKKRIDDSELQLKMWTSDVIRPGRIGYQLALVRGSLTIQFPTDWENYGARQVREMYNSVNSIEDFDRLRDDTR